jgi:hypothetical protein
MSSIEPNKSEAGGLCLDLQTLIHQSSEVYNAQRIDTNGAHRHGIRRVV